MIFLVVFLFTPVGLTFRDTKIPTQIQKLDFSLVPGRTKELLPRGCTPWRHPMAPECAINWADSLREWASSKESKSIHLWRAPLIHHSLCDIGLCGFPNWGHSGADKVQYFCVQGKK